MQTLTPPPILHQFFPHNLHFSLYHSSKIQHETEQLHAFSLKTGVFNHSSISSRLISLYADGTGTSNLLHARSVFDQIEEPSLLLWNLMIKCYVENQASHDAIALFSQKVGDLMPDNFTLPCVIKGCARLQAVEEGNQIHGLALKIGFGLDKFVQSSLVSLYSKCGQIDWARKLFDKMDEKDLVLWNSLIDGCARCGELELALKMFDEMPERDSFSWTALLDGFSKFGKVETAREIFQKMPSKNLVSWNVMINAYMKAGDFDSALNLFTQMPAKDLITLNSMVGGYELNGRFKEALEMFVTILEEGFKPNDATLVSAISAASGLAVLSNGKWVHSYMVKNGIQLDGVLATLLITMYSKCGSVDDALTVFQAIPKRKLGHWTAIIVGLGMHGRANHALELFNQMRRTNLRPHSITFIGILNACSNTGLVDHGRLYFNMMINEYRIEPTIEHYGCLVDMLCRAGHLGEAKQVIENMPMRPNKIIWMSLLSSAKIHRNTALGEYAAGRLLETYPETTECYVLLSNIYASANKWEKVAEVREMMKKRGIKKDPGYSSIEHRGVLHNFIVADKSHIQTAEIYSKLREWRKKLKVVGHVPDTSQVLLCIEGEEEKEAELETHSERLAIAFGLINKKPGTPIRILKNLRVCNDCHSVTKLLSKIYNREIIVRDNSRFHHFKNGSCSCNDFW